MQSRKKHGRLWHNPRLANRPLQFLMMSGNRIDESVELLCQKGCKALWSDIDKMEQGRVLPELQELNDRERAEVLKEIKSIMAVYKGSCSL